MRQATDAFLATLDQYVLSDVIRSPRQMRALLTVAET